MDRLPIATSCGVALIPATHLVRVRVKSRLTPSRTLSLPLPLPLPLPLTRRRTASDVRLTGATKREGAKV